MTPSSEAERRLVGSVMDDPSLYEQVQVTPIQFDDLKLRAIWKAIGDLRAASKPADPLSVADQLGEALESCGGLSGLTDILLHVGVVTPESTSHYADIVRDAYLSRQVRRKCSEILEAAKSESGADLLARLGTSSDALRGSLSHGNRTLDVVVAQELNAALSSSGEARGVITGLGIEKWVPCGYPKKKVTVMFSDTGSFKTTTIMQSSFSMAKRGYRGMVFSIEDPDELQADRFISRKTGVGYGRIASGVLNDAERQKLKSFDPGEASYLRNIVCNDSVEPQIDHLIREVAAENARRSLDYVIVDYMQLMEGRGDRQSVFTEAMRKSAYAAKRMDLAWIWISQKNDRAKERKNPRPYLEDMFGSASLKQMSKLVLALFRPSSVWPEPSGDDHPLYGIYSRFLKRFPGDDDVKLEAYNNIVELHVLKNVLGANNKFKTLIAKPNLGILEEVDIRGFVS